MIFETLQTGTECAQTAAGGRNIHRNFKEKYEYDPAAVAEFQQNEYAFLHIVFMCSNHCT